MRKFSLLMSILLIVQGLLIASCKSNLKLTNKTSDAANKNKITGSESGFTTENESNNNESTSFTSSCFSLSGSVNENICEIEALIIKKTNSFRAQQGLSELTTNKALSYSARLASATNTSWNPHAGFPGQRYANLRKCDSASGSDSTQISNLTGENWAMYPAYSDSESIASGFVNMWINSPGHRSNMVGNHTYIGVGVTNSGSYYYSVQVFAR